MNKNGLNLLKQQLSQKKKGPFLILCGSLLFFILVTLPTTATLNELRDQTEQMELKTSRLLRMEQFILDRPRASGTRSMSLVRFLEEASKQLSLEDNLKQVRPSMGEVAFEMSDVTIPELLLLCSVIEESPPVGQVSFLKLVPEDSEANRFFVQGRMKER